MTISSFETTSCCIFWRYIQPILAKLLYFDLEIVIIMLSCNDRFGFL